jgi:hypothetical protein
MPASKKKYAFSAFIALVFLGIISTALYFGLNSDEEIESDETPTPPPKFQEITAMQLMDLDLSKCVDVKFLINENSIDIIDKTKNVKTIHNNVANEEYYIIQNDLLIYSDDLGFKLLQYSDMYNNPVKLHGSTSISTNTIRRVGKNVIISSDENDLYIQHIIKENSTNNTYSAIVKFDTIEPMINDYVNLNKTTIVLHDKGLLYSLKFRYGSLYDIEEITSPYVCNKLLSYDNNYISDDLNLVLFVDDKHGVISMRYNKNINQYTHEILYCNKYDINQIIPLFGKNYTISYLLVTFKNVEGLYRIDNTSTYEDACQVSILKDTKNHMIQNFEVKSNNTIYFESYDNERFSIDMEKPFETVEI